MTKNTTTSTTDIISNMTNFDENNREVMISVKNVSMVYRRATEQLNSFKEYAIKIAKGQLRIQGFSALDDVSFEVHRGDVFGIVGTNGSGKSTLLKIIAGVLEPSQGTCVVNGSIAPLIELGAGFDPELTARENVYLNGALLGYSKKFIDENFEEIVTFAEVEDYLDMPLKNYSSGMVARIAFAIATVIVPDILLVDEVLSVGDFMFQRKCEDRIKELIEKHGVTVLLVSHSNEQIARLCDRALWIEKGHTRMLDDAKEVCRIYSALGGRVGSKSSEERILEAEKDKRILPDDAYSSIHGDDSYETSVRAARKAWNNEAVENLVITCGKTHINTILANGLAGALNAPILQTRTSYLPASVKQFLSEYKPRNIYYFDSENDAPNPLDALQKLDWSPEVISFVGNGNFFQVSQEIFEYGAKRNLWGSSAAVIHFNDNAESLAAAPFLFKNNMPVFSSADKTPLKVNDLLSCLSSAKFKQVYIFGKHSDPELPKLLNDAGFEVTSCVNEVTHRACRDISELTFNSLQGNRELCIASMSLSLWQDALMGGPYCAKQNGALLLQESTSLDSMTDCLDFVASNKNVISGITFFGGDSNLDELDRELLGKEYFFGN